MVMVDDSRITRLEREIHRLRISPSLRLGSHLTDAVRKPWRAPFLVFSLPLLMLIIGLESLGLKKQPPAYVTKSSGRKVTKGDCIVMFPTNGVGFGHFTRMLAIAKRMKAIKPDLEIIFFTTMPTLHILKKYGIPAHHIPGRKYFRNMDTEEWNGLLEEELSICFEVHKPSMFIFDGAFPYRGMLRAIQHKNMTKKIWLRRGMFRKGSSIPVDSIEHFDAVIHPQDSHSNLNEFVQHSLEVLHCPPIIMLEPEEIFSKEKSRRLLAVPDDCICIYVQLGAGEINDIESEIRITLEALTKHENVYVVLGESLIGNRIDFDLPRVRIVRDYPNSLYFRGFDATIQAGGYNSFHETKFHKIPALFFPNLDTGMDDQLARCLVAEEEGWGIVLKSRSISSIGQSCERLIDMIGDVEFRDCENGANSLASRLVEEIK